MIQMNKFIFLLFSFFLSYCNGSNKKEEAVKCKCLKDGMLRISISAESEDEARKDCIERLSGQMQDCE